MRSSLTRFAAVLGFVAIIGYAPAVQPVITAASGPQFQSIGPLTFGPDGTLYAADSAAATIFAVNLGGQDRGGKPGTVSVDGIDQKIAALLGTDVKDVAIADLAVHPATKNSFLAVMRGQGANARPALVRVDGAGAVTLVNTDALSFTSVALPNVQKGDSQRTQSLTQVKFAEGRVWVSGLSNEEFASKLWSIPYPFTKGDGGTSLEIFHDNHRQLETRAPMYAFVPYAINGQPHIVGAYTCTPLVKFPVAELKPASGSKYRGTTIAELGAGNRPIDMIVYSKDGKDFLLMANTRRGVMKIPTSSFASAAPITTPSNTETAGVPFEKVAAMTDIQQLAQLDATHSVVIRGSASALALNAVALP